MLKIVRHSDADRTKALLIGQAGSEHLGEITNQLGRMGSRGSDVITVRRDPSTTMVVFLPAA